jgi:hypothetical protein
MMISGSPPFRGENECEVMESVLKENVQFKGNILSIQPTYGTAYQTTAKT